MRRTLTIAAGTVAAMAATSAPALAATPHAKAAAKHFTEVEAGTQLSATGLKFEDVFKVKSSPDGGGSVIRDFALTGAKFPATGRDTATSYYRSGKLVANETVTLGAPLFTGVGAISGTGTCVSGTLKHYGETCTYTLKGSYDLITGRTYLTLTGTYTLSSAPKKK